jgi:hypothetical protein
MDRAPLVAGKGLRRRLPALQPEDMQNAAFGVHLVKFYAAGFRHTQSMPEHQKQEATVASLIHVSSRCLDQPLNLAPSEVLPAAVSCARVCALVPGCHFVESLPSLQRHETR